MLCSLYYFCVDYILAKLVGLVWHYATVVQCNRCSPFVNKCTNLAQHSDHVLTFLQKIRLQRKSTEAFNAKKEIYTSAREKALKTMQEQHF